MSVANFTVTPPRGATLAARVLIVCLLLAAYLPIGPAGSASAAGVDHLVVSEVMTGGASASDEMIEIYNPSSAALPLEGLELIYVTATGTTVTRRAAWSLGGPVVPPGAHVLVANELGVFAPIADALYASGMAATGGSVALRIQGATSAIDAVGWGTAASTWLEGIPAPAPPAGTSLERLPGGPAGSTTDTNSNVVDFTTRSVPDPQNSGSPPVPDTQPSPTPSPTPGPTDAPTPAPTATAIPPTPSPTTTPGPTQTATPSPTSTPEPTPSSTPAPTPTMTPAPTPIPIATARALADDTVVTVEGVALSPSDFTEGGGYIADASGGIAVLLDEGSFARGDQLRVRGALDDRFAQRTIRASGDGITITGSGPGPDPVASTTGSVNEFVEARLVRIQGTVDGSATTLSGGLAFDVDDGSGAIRVLVGTATGIDTSSWADGVRVAVVGVVGQRDSSGTGSSGYRVQPRAADDIQVLPPPSPTPTPTGGESASPTPTPTPTPSDGSVITIAAARAAAKHARVTVRGVVTLAPGTVEAGSAAIQDATGAILLRLGDEAEGVSRGQLVEVVGARSTKSGMETLRVTDPPLDLGSTAEPAARAVRSGEAGEALEAHLVIVRGAVVASARTASSGTVSFELNDGSGPLRIVLGASLDADREPFAAGTWVEVRGVLGQETSGAQPSRGYRVWPRDADDVRILAGATGMTEAAGSHTASSGEGGGGSSATASLAEIREAGAADLRVGATLVASAWPELGVAGLLWDGARLVGIAPASGARVEGVMNGRAVPLSLELGGLRELAPTAGSVVSLVVLGDGPSDTSIGSRTPAPPSTTMPGEQDPPAWVSLVGKVRDEHAGQVIEVDRVPVLIEQLCGGAAPLPTGTASLVGVATASPARILVGCDGLRPAPVLARATTSPGLTELATTALAAAKEPHSTAPDGRRLLAMGLLSIGVAILVLAAVAGRRVGPEESDAAERDEEEVEPGTPAGPQLTLVRLPDEHGP